jgi:hypothetical protein
MDIAVPETSAEASQRDGTTERHDLMGGKCYVYKRSAQSKYWQAAAYVGSEISRQHQDGGHHRRAAVRRGMVP